MADFKFKLEFLIQMRRRKEEEAMARLAKRLASIRELEEEIVDLKATRARLAAELDDKIKAGQLTIPLLVMYKDYDGKMSRDINRAEEFLFLSRREEAKDRAALTRASVERKIIEKLKEKQKVSFVAEDMYRQQNILEEMASLAKARRDRQTEADRMDS